jgi:flagellar hook-associated protein 3 FlgL
MRVDTTEVRAYLDRIHEGRAQVVDMNAITGIRQVQVETATETLTNEDRLISEASALNREVDLFDVLTDLEQTTQAMQVMTISERELLNTSLLDFIR